MTDTHELDDYAVHLGRAGREVTVRAGLVINRAAHDVAQGMAQDFSGHRGAPYIADAVDYDLRGLSFEVGVNKGKRQGGLGNILAFGTSKTAPVVDHEAALRRELPNILDHLGKAGVEGLE